jgi:predicted alpha/beta-fold hydrolase
MADFSPRRPWLGGDLQTIRNYALNVQHALPNRPSQCLVVPLDDGSGDALVASVHLPDKDRGKPLVALIHGISGHESSCYIVLAAAYFLIRDHPVLRVNQRGAGPSRPHCRGQYHAGLTGDFATLLAKLDPALTRNGIAPVGFSLGGNMLLKFLGEAGRHAPVLRAATVSAPIDLAHSSKALMRWRNYLYHRYILDHTKRNCTAPGAQLTDAERSAILRARSLWQFDHEFTARRHGYTGADAYYEANSARHYLGGIRVPTLMIHAKDDPFVPAMPYLQHDWSKHPELTPLLSDGGGHLGFHDPLGVWHLRKIAAFLESE